MSTIHQSLYLILLLFLYRDPIEPFNRLVSEVAHSFKLSYGAAGRCNVDPATCQVWVAFGNTNDVRICMPGKVKEMAAHNQHPTRYFHKVDIMSNWERDYVWPPCLYKPEMEGADPDPAHYDLNLDMGYRNVKDIVDDLFAHGINTLVRLSNGRFYSDHQSTQKLLGTIELVSDI